MVLTRASSLRPMEAVRKDADRVQKKTDCCLPAAVEMPECFCCAGNVEASEHSLNL